MLVKIKLNCFSVKFLCIALICSLSFGCDEPIQKFSRISTNPYLGKGEWIEDSDTLNGISVRKNFIAYFENMTFTSDDVNEYTIVDSIYIKGKDEIFKAEYLIVEKLNDTLKFKILKRDEKLIILEDIDGEKTTFKFWR